MVTGANLGFDLGWMLIEVRGEAKVELDSCIILKSARAAKARRKARRAR